MDIGRLIATEDRDSLEAWCRAHTQVVACGRHAALCRVLGKYLMYVDTEDISISPHLMMNGCWEMWITQAVARHVKPGMRCVDVGANFGYYTLFLADLVGETGHVSALEPNPDAYDYLERTLAVNGCSNVAPHEVAAGSATGEQVLYWTRRDIGASKFTPPDGVVRPCHESVKVCALDLLLGESPVHFIKIDVEGAERVVWEGMQQVLSQSPDVTILMEFNPRDVPEPEQFLVSIQQAGFRLASVGHDGQVRTNTLSEALVPDTGPFRMLWLTRGPR